ncbi:Ribonuclease H-like superfamily [Arabidopsis thaliana x Arabidopsis arenosa]|uniref:Ribonuclease H-like superfamily n=1 Tax=Arabidopsis thaliana x Arabidopsis arenosa TaxID=1240361 RepID=A0A8T2BTS8_9BRAS|nr:Ribonuclease H-like superfamily [Arabidopsis thaliana x Arabidopsis arenosa]
MLPLLATDRMERRFTYSEKGKGKAHDTEERQRGRVRAKETNTSQKIQEHDKTLIGRVTNPREQGIGALFSHLMRRWPLRGRADGADLGDGKFLFRFEREDDITQVLENRPYSFNRWMVIVQKWEPIISPLFPSEIPFWIRIKGLPLHYWQEELVEDIGKEAGRFVQLEIQPNYVRTRVDVNGLAPILTDTVVEFQSGETVTVHLEYERLDKFCNYCKRLTHAETDCELKPLSNTAKDKRSQAYSDQGREEHKHDVPRKGIRREEFHQRLDRHGRPFGERPSSRNFYDRRSRDRASMESVTSASKQHMLLRDPTAGTSNPKGTTQHERADYEQRRLKETEPRQNVGPQQTISSQGHKATTNVSNYVNAQEDLLGLRPYRHREDAFRTPVQYVWKEKTQKPQQEEGVEISQIHDRVRPLERNLAIVDYPQPSTGALLEEDEETLNATIRYINHPDPTESLARRYRVAQADKRISASRDLTPQIGLPNSHSPLLEAEIEAELEDLTTQYVNCANPIERAARQQRVLLGEENHLIRETASAIIKAALNKTGQSSQCPEIAREEFGASRMEEQESSAQLQSRNDEIDLGPLSGPSRKRERSQSHHKQRQNPIMLPGASSKKRNACRFQTTPRRLHTSNGFRRETRSTEQLSPPRIGSTTPPRSNGPRDLQQEQSIPTTSHQDPDQRNSPNSDTVVTKELEPLQYQNIKIVSPHSPGGGGLALLWTDEVNLEVLQVSQHFIDTQITYKGKRFFATFIYGEPDKDKRKPVWDTITEIASQRVGPWFQIGDFNEILCSEEKSGGPQRSEGSFTNFRNFVAENDLYDLRHSGNPLSWRGQRNSHLVFCRLDRALANGEWSDMFPTSRIEYMKFEGSDHRPIMAYFAAREKKERRMFRYDRSLRKNPEIFELVKKAWDNKGNSTVADRILRCRKAIQKWHRKHNQNNQKTIEEKKEKLDQALTDTTPDLALIQTLSQSLRETYEAEENYWRQRSRQLWLALGDRNSSYFHATTRGRRALNRFSVIENDDGTVFFEEEHITAVISEYFSKIYSSQPKESSGIIHKAVKCVVTEEMNRSLLQMPSVEEIKNACFSIHGDKAPGPDGFTACFFQSNWKTMEKEIVAEIRNFFDTGILPAEVNKTHIRLIPKIQNPQKVKDYRPIALCSVYYKIYSKLLTKRLQPFLNLLISENQTAFVPGRAISDNVLITHELLHTLQKSQATKRCSMAIKTDMTKAYDRLEWDFIQKVLHQMGFDKRWIRWVMQAVTTVTYSFLINGKPRGSVSPQRGIRQGRREVKRTSYIKIRPGDYEEASGQLINKDKSSITFSPKTSQDIRNRVKHQLGITKEGGTGKYLGLPELFGRKKRDLFESIVTRIKMKAASWSSKRLSAAGKLTMLKSVLTAIPSYSMSCFLLPIGLCKRIQSALTRFFWDSKQEKKGMAWVSFNSLTQSKDNGGLGIREIQSFNEALLAKLSWRLINNPTSLLSRMLLAKYCRNRPFMEVTPKPSSSHGWKGILAGRDLLREGMGIAIGNGQTTNVWRDPWTAMISPGITTGPAPGQQANLMVADLIDETTKEWNVGQLQALFPTIWTDIMQLRPMENRSGDHEAVPIQSFAWKKEIWNLKCSPKIHMLLWRAARGTLPVGTNLLRRKVTNTATCLRCGEEESELHLFFQCPFAREVWQKAPLHAPVSVASITELKQGISLCNSLQKSPAASTSNVATAPWLFWSLWSSRNKLIFDKRFISEEETILTAISAEDEWKKAQLVQKSDTERTLNTSANNTIRQRTDHEEIPPGTLFVQTDAAWIEHSKNAGLGWVCLSSNRAVRARSCKPVPFVKGPSEAEALCIYEALLSLQTQQESKIIIESDAKNVIMAIASKQPPLNLKGIIEDILHIAKSFCSLSFRFIPRSENLIADDLAKTAARSMTSGLIFSM